VIGDIIRGRIGFDGWLMSDDIGMEALAGDFASRAAGVVAAGCDVALHCSGKMEEMIAVASAVPAMSPEGEARLARAMATVMVDDDEGLDLAEAMAKRDALLALV
jgi:beta-N-acetylhexosaminidase